MFKIDFLNDFHIDIDDENIKYFVVKKFKFIHKNEWFKKFIDDYVIIYVVVVSIKINVSTITISLSISNFSQITIFVMIELQKLFKIKIEDFDLQKINIDFFVTSIEIVLFNDVIIYNFNNVDLFVKIIENFFTFWQNIDFVKMSKKIEWKYHSKMIEKNVS